MRKFDNYTDAEKIRALTLAFAFAITAPPDKRAAKDIYALAAEHGKLSGLRAEDFDMIKHRTIGDIALECSSVNY